MSMVYGFPWVPFAAFGDYKPSLPIYLTIPFIAIFGLSDLAVRLPSAIFGILTVLFIYFLVKELFSNQRLALTSALFLAISPWHIMLSRAGFEANIAIFLLHLAYIFCLFHERIQTYCLLLFCHLSQACIRLIQRDMQDLLSRLECSVFRGVQFRKRKLSFIKGFIIAVIALLPLMPHLVSREARLRFQEVSIFTNLETVLISNVRSLADSNAWWSKIVHNRRIGYGREYLLHFFDNLEPRFLFIKGDGNPKFSTQDIGQLLLVTAPFVFIGWLTLFSRQTKIVGCLYFGF